MSVISLTIFQDGSFKLQSQNIASTRKLDKQQDRLRAECPKYHCGVN